MTTTKPGTRPLVEEFLPEHDFSAAYEIRIHAPVSVVYERLLAMDFFALRIVRFLMFLRTGKRPPRHRAASDLHHGFEGPGFVVLAERPREEILIGVAGRFWRPDGGRRLDLKPNEFAGFAQAGQAKAAWNFRLQTGKGQETVLSTETRVECFGRAARWKFGVYWALIAPFSGAIRKALLRQVKTDAEAATKTAPHKQIA